MSKVGDSPKEPHGDSEVLNIEAIEAAVEVARATLQGKQVPQRKVVSDGKDLIH